jgi:hypothetical protein
MKLAGIRQQVATTAAAALPATVAVYDHLPDQVAVPAVLVGWSDPMLTAGTMCAWQAGVDLLTVAGRVDTAGQTEVLEDIVGALVDAFDDDPYVELDDPTGPFAVTIAGVAYLANRLTVHLMTGD